LRQPWLLRLHSQLYDQSERYRRLSIPLAKQEPMWQEHQRILDVTLKRCQEGRGTSDSASDGNDEHSSCAKSRRALLQAGAEA